MVTKIDSSVCSMYIFDPTDLVTLLEKQREGLHLLKTMEGSLIIDEILICGNNKEERNWNKSLSMDPVDSRSSLKRRTHYWLYWYLGSPNNWSSSKKFWQEDNTFAGSVLNLILIPSVRPPVTHAHSCSLIIACNYLGPSIDISCSHQPGPSIQKPSDTPPLLAYHIAAVYTIVSCFWFIHAAVLRAGPPSPLHHQVFTDSSASLASSRHQSICLRRVIN